MMVVERPCWALTWGSAFGRTADVRSSPIPTGEGANIGQLWGPTVGTTEHLKNGKGARVGYRTFAVPNTLSKAVSR